MEGIKYIGNLLSRGMKLATSSVSVLIPTIVIYLFSSRTGNYELAPIDLSKGPLQFSIEVVSSINNEFNKAGLVFAIVVFIKILTILFASEDIFRLRIGQGNIRYASILSTNKSCLVIYYFLAYLVWSTVFVLIAFSTLFFVEIFTNSLVAWGVAIGIATILFPIYYAGVSFIGFVFAAFRAGARIDLLMDKIYKNKNAIYLFYSARSFFDLLAMIGIPIIAFRITESMIPYLLICIIFITPVILFIRTTSQYFKADILEPNDP